MRLVTDTIEYGGHSPQWNTISISGYHIREAGATTAQELAFTLAWDGACPLGAASRADIDAFSPG